MPTPNTVPQPQPTNPNPGALPIEVDTGGLHEQSGLDFGNEPVTPLEPEKNPEKSEPQREIPGPETEPS